jgi:hypothetical protein
MTCGVHGIYLKFGSFNGIDPIVPKKISLPRGGPFSPYTSSPRETESHPTSRDGNGDPIPDSPRGIPPLGDGDGE